LDSRTNPNLIPWVQLDNQTKKYDRDAVSAIPELLREVTSMEICRRRDEPSGPRVRDVGLRG
jgi:hypothetical protein